MDLEYFKTDNARKHSVSHELVANFLASEQKNTIYGYHVFINL